MRGELRYFAVRLSPKFTELELLPLADWHFGDPLCSEHHIDRDLNYLQTHKNAFGLLVGDLANTVLRNSVGDVYGQQQTIQEQIIWIKQKIWPVRSKMLGAVTGNHEWRVYEMTGIDITMDIANAMGIPYRAEGMLLKISFGSNNSYHTDRPYTYWIYMTHGYGGARTKSAKAVKVERTGTWIDADVYVMAHDHVVNVAPDVQLHPDSRTTYDEATGFTTGAIVAKRKMLVKASACLKWGGYGERKGFPPVDLETPIIKLAGKGKPRVTVEV